MGGTKFTKTGGLLDPQSLKPDPMTTTLAKPKFPTRLRVLHGSVQGSGQC